jgi:hypothetical protein
MPAAPNLETLMNFEEAFEAKFAQVFRDAGFVTAASQADEQRKTPRMEFCLLVGGSREHYMLVAEEKYNDAWNGIMMVVVTTNRKELSTSHSAYRAKVRALMQKVRQGIFNTDYLAMVEAVDSETLPRVDSEKNHDTSQMNFRVVFNIKPTSWTVAP